MNSMGTFHAKIIYSERNLMDFCFFARSGCEAVRILNHSISLSRRPLALAAFTQEATEWIGDPMWFVAFLDACGRVTTS